ncbi:phospholipase A and acyltransferase 3-like [Patiria miniata]|uniref:LRAT domain-containing protein n=1 Tax=Patiria miniata TaxID=46514 RepID=A0A914ADM4_PATMI|nr:phospholipase A and acyltransferase 3-like [Patiria miniata]
MATKNNYGIKGNWRESSFPDINALEDELCHGDRLEFNRGLYSHWGIHVGEYEGMEHAVIHFGKFERGPVFLRFRSAVSEKTEIRADTIGQIIGGSGRVRINNSRDNKEEPLDTGNIIGTAMKMHRDETPIVYNLFSKNCEHFVNLCRYGHPHSDQITAALQTAWNLGQYLLAIGAIIIVTYANSRRRN